ncbi:MAG: serine protein kinase PrkA, partial [Myxococcota bacterium]
MTDTDDAVIPSNDSAKADNPKLAAIFARTEQRFRERRQILSFQEFFDLFMAHPQRYARSVAQYIRDCFDYFGVTERPAPWGTQQRFNLFDCPFDEGNQRLIGQEAAQRALYRLLTNFVQEGRIQRIVLLHGPNGSAKSSLINCVMRALEAYSRTDEGALYTFNWIFPTEKISRGSIGFGGGDVTIDGQPRSALTTYAYLDELSIDAKIGSAMRDHPLLLIPKTEREPILREALTVSGAVISDYLRTGDLDHISKRIFEALLISYQGDMSQVLRHVQIERFFISRRYRVGAVTIEPQLRIDAGSRQITVDRSLQSLPASLQNQTLFEVFGPLVEGNRGMVEYNDILKRQPELNKYLLATGEKGTASLDHANIFLDALLIGSANELYLDAFKKAPDYPSFKARLELVRMPYLLDYKVEANIYDEQISSTEVGKPILPHTALVAALWAVLTRLTRPKPDDSFSDGLNKVIEELTPLQKAELYATGKTPDHLSAELSRELAAIIPELMNQSSDTADYEGRYGASPREMKLLILNAAQNNDYPHLSPLALMDEMRQLVRDPSVYPFLQIKP